VRIRSRAALVLGAIGLALAIAAGVAALVLTRGGGSAEVAGTADALIRVDAASGTVEQRFRLGRGVEGVAAGAGSVWVASVNDSAVWRVNPQTGRAQRITGFLEPHEVHVSESEGFAYVGFRDGIGEIDLATNKEAGTSLKGAIAPTQIDVGPLGTWTTGFVLRGFGFGDTVGKVVSIADFGTPTVPDKIPVEHTPVEGKGFEALADLTVGDTAIWVIGDLLEHAVYRVDPRTRQVARFPLPGPPGNVVWDAGAIWVTGVLDDVVWRVDAVSGQVTDTISVGRAPAGIAVTDDGV
jgi:DNA-binding beta-propeller fold protein YncE